MKTKNKIIVLYGAMAVGKLTVGKILEKNTGFKLTHNHLINDLVDSVFERGTIERDLFIEKLRYEFYDFCIKHKKDIIITHCYSSDYISLTGLSDPKYLKTLESFFKKNAFKYYFIHMQAKNEDLLKRVSNDSRKKYKKLTNKKILKNYLVNSDFKTKAPVDNNFTIDTSEKSPKKVADEIIKIINS